MVERKAKPVALVAAVVIRKSAVQPPSDFPGEEAEH